jgi:hypothetical protein
VTGAAESPAFASESSLELAGICREIALDHRQGELAQNRGVRFMLQQE